MVCGVVLVYYAAAAAAVAAVSTQMKWLYAKTAAARKIRGIYIALSTNKAGRQVGRGFEFV